MSSMMEPETDGRDPRTKNTLLRIAAYVGLAIAAGIGLNIVQGIAENASDTANDLEQVIEDEIEDRAKQELANCRIRNTAIKNGRDRFIKFNNNLSALFQGGNVRDPAAAEEFRKKMFEGINFEPQAEDLDCNNDGELNEDDYAS